METHERRITNDESRTTNHERRITNNASRDPNDEPQANILLVDDEPRNLLALESMLADLGQNLIKAQSGSQALKYLLEKEVAVILLDIKMPDMDGFEIAEIIRKRECSQGVPIIFMTAYSRDDLQMMVKGYSIGAVDYLFKPIIQEILKAKVGVFIELFKKTEQVKRQAEHLYQMQDKEKEKEREVTREKERERELQALRELVGFGKTAISSQMFGQKSLRETDSAIFEQFVNRYGELLDSALEQRDYKVEDNNVSKELQIMGEQMGFLKAGPRDVVEIHSLSLKRKTQGCTQSRAQAYVEEGRLMLIELMGDLASFYRKYAIVVVRES
ncbi:MAG: response regulator [bacterium]